jgi:hypothetical protein
MQVIENDFISPSYDIPRKSWARAHVANGIGTHVLENIPLKSTGNNLRESIIMFAVACRERENNSLFRLVRVQIAVGLFT